MKSFERYSIYIHLLSFSTLVSSQTCKFLNGTDFPNSSPYEWVNSIRPCGGDVGTICCSTARQNPPGSVVSSEQTRSRDECLPNGLCQNRYILEGQEEEQIEFRVNFCTEDYLSGKCLDVCRETRDPGGGSRMTPCDGGPTNASSTRWCCGTSNTCCENLVDVITLPQRFKGITLYTSSVSSLAPTTVTQTLSPSTGTSRPTTSPQAQDQEDSSLSTGAKAGIGIGAALGVIGAVIAALVVFRTLRRKKQPYHLSNDTGFNDYTKESYQHHHAGYPSTELNNTPIAELQSSTPPPSELPGEVPSDTKYSSKPLPTISAVETKPGLNKPLVDVA